MNKLIKITMPCGMIGVGFYFLHIVIGRILWPVYNPITTDISTLTATGSPNAELLRVFTALYGAFVLLFCVGMILYARKHYGKAVQIGWWLFFFMNMVSAVGYALFPLSGDKTQMTFQNTMHIVVTLFVVLSTIAGAFTLAIGYLKEEKMIFVGRIILIFAVIITTSGALNPIGMANGWNMLGLTERISIYAIQALIFFLSCYYTKKKTL